MTNNFLIDNFKHLTTTPENVEQLKKMVLQMAVQGKLTAKWREQNPSVESAKVLLEKIKTEKEQLIKEGKIKRQKPLPPIADEEKPFELPDSWTWERLGNIGLGFEYGTSSKSASIGDVPVLRMGNIQEGKIIWDSLVFSSNESDNLTYLLKKHDLLFNRTNSRELVGKTALFISDRKAIFAGYLVRFSMLDKVSSLYTNYVMNSPLHRNWCDEVKTDAIGQSNINATKLKSFRFPLPPLAEQQAIVSQVEKLFTQIDQLHALAQKRLNYRDKSSKALFSKINHAENDTELQKTWQTLTAHFHSLTQSKESVKQLRQSILQMAVQGKLTAKWREDNRDVEPASVLLEKIRAKKEQLIKSKRIKKLKYLKDSISKDIKEKVPKKWVITNLGNVISYRKGKKPSILVDKKSKEYCIPYIDIKAFEKNIILKYTNEEKVVRCSPDDILIVWDGARMGLTGTNASGALGSTLAKIEYYGILKDYLYLFFKSKYELINSNPKQAGLPHVNPGLLENMEFMFPCIEEQKAIVSKVKQLMAWCDELEKKIEKRDAYQEKMMQAVVKQAFKTEKEPIN